MKIVKNFQLRIVIFSAVKNRCILHGLVFVMKDCAVGAHYNHSLKAFVADAYLNYLEEILMSTHNIGLLGTD